MNETSAAADPGSMLLRLDDVSVRYGAILALEGISAGVRHGEIVAVMGPNGAGKSTVLKAIMKLAPVVAGSVCWKQEPLDAETQSRARSTSSRVPTSSTREGSCTTGPRARCRRATS